MALSPAQAFGLAVREVRKRKNLSQEEAALTGGIDRSYFGHIERALKTPTLTTVWKVADALDVPPSLLLAETERILKQNS